ncbi:MAG: cytochrome c biogenesis protein CcsA [Coriobacteriia bacterium]|nr:cytochrome c biogenesis protein CcsA [Coriobacteriia bacterium]
MSMIGLIALLVAFAATAVAVVCLLAGFLLGRKRATDASDTLTWAGHVAVFLATAALTVCCGVLVYCFFAGDYSIEYVLNQHSNASGDLAWLYKLSGLWAGREGSLLFWAWLISVFSSVVAARDLKNPRKLDSMALFVLMAVLAAFVGVMLFSESNMPFTVTPDKYYGKDGELTTAASLLGMNTLLEHWAMAIHPPTLFVGYAGLTVPFAYAIAALVVNDPSKEWVVRAERYALFSWLFLGIGIGLGAVWAYVVLGWGGYWGWDAVENASLLSWIVGVALIHSFTVYRQRGAFKRWSIMCACITFAFVIVGTFISRSGLVQSVHAFEGDPVSLVLFGALIVCSVLAGAIGLAIRWKSFGATSADDMESMASKEAAYYFNNVIMVVFAVLLAYLTVSSALPSVLPFGGEQVSAGTYNAIARPLGIVYLAILAVCPLLAWGKTDPREFLRTARVPAICALVLFVVLMVYWATYLVPSYDAVIAVGDTNAESLASEGPAAYYNGLAAVGFLVASLLLFNSLFVLVRAVRSYGKAHDVGALAALGGLLSRNASRLGGFLSHFAMAVILVGLIGSSMYVTEVNDYVPYDEATDTAGEAMTVQDFTLTYASNSVEMADNKDDIVYTVVFDVYKGDAYLGQVSPAVQVVLSTQQQKLVASVLSLPTEDLFVVYRGVNDDGAFSMDVRVNPLVSEVWIGFGLLMVGVVVATFGGRGAKRAGKVATKKQTSDTEA